MPNALVWGASGGIGSAVVNTLKNNGWSVYGAARNPDAIPAHADGKFAFDANDPNSIKEVGILLAHDAVDLDLTVYAAGGIVAAPVTEIGEANWTQVMNVNLHGFYLATQCTLHLVNEGGAVMVIGAYVDKIGFPKFGAYAAAKAGLDPLMTILGKENRKINFTVVRPPAVAGRFWEDAPMSEPKGAMRPQQVADAMLAHYNEGTKGTLDL